MSNGTQQPTQFNLQGDGVTVSYSSTSFTGAPQFSYRDATHNVDRSGDDIRGEDTEIGTLVTIDIIAAAETPDVETLSFSLVLPRISLGPDNQPVTLQTIGVRTTDHTTAFVPGPILGAGQTYETVELKGTARLVIP
jgi:hypothetical protein